MKPFDIRNTTLEPHLFPEDATRMPRDSEPVRPEVMTLDFPQFMQRTRRVHLLTQSSKRRRGLYAKGLDGKPEDYV